MENKEMSSLYSENIAVIGQVHYFRNNSTGKPTLRHIINEKTGNAYCGFDHVCAEVHIVDESDYILSSEVCTKCRKASNSHNPLTQ